MTAYAARFNNKDRGNGVIFPGAFAKTLREDGLPLIRFQYKMDDAIGAHGRTRYSNAAAWRSSWR